MTERAERVKAYSSWPEPFFWRKKNRGSLYTMATILFSLIQHLLQWRGAQHEREINDEHLARTFN